MLRRVAVVRIEIPEERIASIIRVARIGELRTMLAATIDRSTLRRNTLLLLLVTANVPSSPILVTLMTQMVRFSETFCLTRATRRNIPEDGILHSHRRKNVNSFYV
jgi:hypothetical protein